MLADYPAIYTIIRLSPITFGRLCDVVLYWVYSAMLILFISISTSYNNSTWLLLIITGANILVYKDAKLQFTFLCLEYSLIYAHGEDPWPGGTGSLSKEGLS